jgi:hypothetical protein
MPRRFVFIYVFLFLLIPPLLSAQTVQDPNDQLYRYIDRWEGLGLITPPPIRPYPLQTVKFLLKEVIGNGPADEAEIAEAYLSGFEDDAYFGFSVLHENRFGTDGFYAHTGGQIRLWYAPHPIVSALGQFNLLLVDRAAGYLLPEGERRMMDWIEDWSDVDLFGRNLLVRQGFVTDLSVGLPNLYFQTGIMRSSFGPFWEDGAVLSPQAPFAGRFSFVWDSGPLGVTITLLPITATDDDGEGSFYPEKYFIMHSGTIRPASWVELSLFESVVWGGRAELLYFIPLSAFFHSQSFGGFSDNSCLGLSAVFKPVQNMRIPILLYTDDVHFNDLARFDFKTKYKIALQTGVSWFPFTGPFRELSADYLMVTPYTYSHRDQIAGAPNYSNYTHMGTPLGPSLDPNSDRFTLDASVSPLPFFNIGFRFRTIRHGNASAGITDGDGTIFDDGYDDSGSPTFQSETRFLSQDVLEKTLQLRLDADYTLWKKWGRLRGELGYTFERILNAGLVQGELELNHYFSLSLGYQY